MLVALEPNLAACVLDCGSSKRLTRTVHPDSIFLSQGRVTSDGTQGDLFTLALDLQGVAGTEL
jgi:hypothetical protein